MPEVVAVAHVVVAAEVVAHVVADVPQWAPVHRVLRHGQHQKLPGRRQPLPDLRLNLDLRFLR